MSAQEQSIFNIGIKLILEIISIGLLATLETIEELKGEIE